MAHSEIFPAPIGLRAQAAGQVKRCGLVTAFASACGVGLAGSERMQPLLVEIGRDGGGAVLGLWQIMAAGAVVSALAMSLIGAYSASDRMLQPDQRPGQRQGLLGTSMDLMDAVSAAGFVVLGALLVGGMLAGLHGLADIPVTMCACLSTLLTSLSLGLLSAFLGPDRRHLTLSHLYGLSLSAKLQAFVMPVLLLGASLACLWTGASPAWTGALLAIAAVAPVAVLLSGPPRAANEQQLLMEFHGRGNVSNTNTRILQ